MKTQRKFVIISHSFFLRIRNVSDRICRKKSILCSVTFYSENLVVFYTMWNNILQSDRLQITVSYGQCAWHTG